MPFYKTFTPSQEEMETACKKPLHPDAETGIRLFNEGKYFAAHEELETAWLEEPHPDRRLYQGILQAGIAYMHARDAHYRGVFSMYERCRVWLWPWSDHCWSIDVGQMKADLQALVEEVERLGPDGMGGLDQKYFTKIERV